MFTIKLSDGTKLKNIALNGDTFVSQSEIEDSVFEGKLGTVEITDEESKEVKVLHDAQLRLNTAFGDEWWFVIQEKSADEKAQEAATEALTEVQIALAELYEMIIGQGG